MLIQHRSTATVLAAQPLAEFLERAAGGGRGHLGIDLHRDRCLINDRYSAESKTRNYLDQVNALTALIPRQH
jgi:hypothetical protein